VCGAWATPDNQTTIARRAEELGYSSLWTIQRVLYAHQPRNEYYGHPGAWPDYFRSVVDPTVSLAYVAATTSRIRLGCAVYNAPFTNPILFAKQLSTLDVLSTGRLDVGVGLGWSRDEYVATGAQWSRRGARFDEFLDCLIKAWSEDTVVHHGEFFEIPPSSIAPKPVQQPHPPLLVGGHSTAALQRAVRIGTGYITGNLALESVEPLTGELHALCETAGRDPASLRLIGRGSTAVVDRADHGSHRRPLMGSLNQIFEGVDAYSRVGFDELFLDLNMDTAFASPEADPQQCLDTALELLERVAPLAAQS
jgi:probable F420-dependent oxidoreductase